MAFKSRKSAESDKNFTLLNVLTAARAVGGVALGLGMAKYQLDPTFVAGAAATLALTDAEGTLLDATRRFPRLQKAMRIIPSRIGRFTDPIADKIYAISIMGGGLASGSIPVYDGFGILATEIATAMVTGVATLQGKETEVSGIGKLGMIARCGAIASHLSAAAVGSGDLHEALTYTGHGSAGLAVVLGTMSCLKIFQQSKTQPTEQSSI